MKIKNIKYNKNIKLDNISEYQFELVKIKAEMFDDEEIEMYLTMVKRSRIKESIFCYWCSIYEEELLKAKENENAEIILNKVLISELNKKKYQQSIFLEIENNRTQILETGTEVNFIEIVDYINYYKNKYENLLQYFDENNDNVLLIGMKMKRERKTE